MKKELTRTLTFVLVFTLLASIVSFSVNAADIYCSVNQEEFFDVHNRIIECDYAGTSVTEYGGDENWTPTDFVAYTFGKGTDWYGFTKVLYVYVDFADYFGNYTVSGGDREEVPYYETELMSAVVVGSQFLEDEYGLETFTSRHCVSYYTYSYVDRNGDPIEVPISQDIYFDTTGNDIVPR